MFKQTFCYAISIAMMRGVSLLMLPVMTGYLSPEELGEIELLSSIAIFGSILVSGGLESALFRYAGTAPEKDRREIASSIYTFSFLLGFLFLVIFFPFAKLITDLIPAPSSIYSVKLILVLLCLESVIAVPLGYLRMTDQCFKFCFSSCVRTALHAGVTLYFLYSGKGVEGVLEASLIAALMQAGLLAFWQFQSTKFSINLNLYRPVFVYSGPIIASGLIAFGLNGVDRWAIATFQSLDSVALYAIALKFSIALTILMQPYGIWWMPKRFSMLNKPNGRALTSKYSTIGLVMIAYTSVIIGVIAPQIIHHTLPDFYLEAIPVLFALILVAAVKEATEIVNIGCLMGERTYLQFGINACSMLSGGVFMIPAAIYHGVWGVVGVLLCSYTFRMYVFLYFSQKNIYLTYPKIHLLTIYGGVGIILAVLATTGGVNYWFMAENPIYLCLITLSVMLVLYSTYRCMLVGDWVRPLPLFLSPYKMP
ncbi:MAG: oligosaccharide flippase family protein [Agarilytica sp.]